MKKNILIVGSAGYIGTVVTKHFLDKNYNIIGIDNLIYRQKKNNFVKNNNNFSFIKLDIKNNIIIKNILKKNKIENVIILAGLVGDPITKKYPKISKSINEDHIIKLIDICYKSIFLKKIIFVSTCSNYGIAKNLPNEKSKLRPLSLYAKSKVKIEKYLLSKRNNKISYSILRFATAFGLSDRMRFDLTLNEFVKTMFNNKILEIYDKDTWRPYCHVKDFAKIIDKVFKAAKRKVFFEVFNAGSSKNNFTKLMIVQKIKKFFKNRKKIKFVDNSKDMRNYEVNFDKIRRKLNFISNWTLEKGIKEIAIKLTKQKYPKSSNGNYKIYN